MGNTDLPGCESFIATDGWCQQHILPEDHEDAEDYNLRECQNCKLSRGRIIEEREYLETLLLMAGRASIRKDMGLGPLGEEIDWIEELLLMEVQRCRKSANKENNDGSE